MMASPPELSLDCKPHSYSLLLKSFGDQQADQSQKLEEFLSRLEEEKLKIHAFKRELPLCMQLITNAMEDSRQRLQSYRANQGPRPVLEEFIPLKQSSSEFTSDVKASSMSDMANWLTSAQLCCQTSDATRQQLPSITSSPNKDTEIGFSVSPKLGLDAKQRNGGAFHPFSKERNSLPDLALANSVEKERGDEKCLEIGNGIDCLRRENCGKQLGGAGVVEHGQGGNGQGESQTITGSSGGGAAAAATNSQGHRKARRCWSPDLHRRFVNALQMLGGSQVATPKQIREHMKVDGLTNDEVKSHLQKYRLHTRRPSPSPQAPGNPAPQLVVLGGIWVPQEYAAAAHGGAPPTLYGTHPSAHASAHYCAPPVPQEFYPAPQLPPPHHQLHHHTLHHQLHMYHHSSPESNVRAGGDRGSESMEDGKSDSGSWKAGDSGGGGERKCEESNGSEISLKF